MIVALVQLDYCGSKGAQQFHSHIEVMVVLFDYFTKLLLLNSVQCVLLSRALEFIYVFLETVVQGEEDLVKCANKAYDASLRKYHGWIVRGVFSVSAPCSMVDT